MAIAVRKRANKAGAAKRQRKRMPAAKRPFLRRNSIVFLDLKLGKRKPKPGELVLAMGKGNNIFHLGTLLKGGRIRVTHSAGSVQPTKVIGNLEKRSVLVLDGGSFHLFPATVISREKNLRGHK